MTEPAFDTAEWRGLRNLKLKSWLQNDSAVDFIVVVGDLCEVIDDLIDADKEVTKADIIRTLYTALVDLPSNPFFKSYSEYLVPVIETGINAWLDANELEKSHDKRDRMFAYVLRDQYMDVLFMCLTITRGRAKMREISLEVREFFTHNETFEDYQSKMEAAT